MFCFSIRSVISYLFFLAAIVMSNPSFAQGAVDSLLGALKSAASDSAKIDLSIKISNEYKASNHSLSLSYAQKAAALAEEGGSLKHQIYALNNAGVTCFYLSLYDQAVSYMNRSAALALEHGEKESVGNAYFNLGNVRIMLKDYDKAGEMYRKALAILEECYKENNKPLPPILRSAFKNNIGHVHLQKKEYKEAERNFMESMAIARKDTLTDQLTKTLSGIADLRNTQKDYDGAILLLNESLALSKQLGNNIGESAALLLLGNSYLAKGESGKALDHYRSGYDIAIRVDALSIKTYTSEGIFKAYKELGQSDSALKYLGLFNEYTSLSNAIEAKEEMTKQELMEEFRIREAAIQKQNRSGRMVYLYIAIVLFAVALALFFFSRASRKKYKQAVLARMELELNAEKQKLQQDLMRSELELKDKQLATQLMYAIKKNEMIGGLVHKLREDSGQLRQENPELVRRLINDLSQTGNDHVWEDFEMRFQHVHTGFYDRLLKICPDLTVNERRICAFLRLDMTTKEISGITGQSVKAISQARIRLRNKLQLTHSETELFDYLSGI